MEKKSGFISRYARVYTGINNGNKFYGNYISVQTIAEQGHDFNPINA
ncbi:MAG TPA: hypothetical protein VFZ52_15980 [Chryseolinea sp.]